MSGVLSEVLTKKDFDKVIPILKYLEEKWYKYRDACYESIAREWCEKYGITVEE